MTPSLPPFPTRLTATVCPPPPVPHPRDANIYTPLLLDPNAVYQPQLLSFGERGTERIYRFKAK